MTAVAETVPIVDKEFKALIPALTDQEMSQLEANILQDGCLEPLIIWREKGILLDGHNRLEICHRYSLEFSTRHVSLPDRNEAKRWIIEHQFGRRNLTPFQRVELTLKLEPLIAAKAKEKQRESGGAVLQKSVKPPIHTQKELAKKADVSHDTIEKGKFLARHADAKTQEKLRLGELSINSAYKAVRKETEQKKRAEAKSAIPKDLPPEDRCRLIRLDIAQAAGLIEPASVDWIITDPPYPRDYLAVYDHLAALANHALKPGGSLIAMVGQSYLPDLIAKLSAKLRYHWILSYLTPGGQSTQLWGRKVNTFWKPLLWFVKGKYEGDWVGDVCRSEVNDNDKRFHGWGQSESGMADILQRFTYPGEVVCDPFMGAGTTGVVAVRMNRRFIGLDVDCECIKKAKARIHSAMEGK
ncbi:MAG: hypothetical protein HZA50_10085 [Planctomycetes bacterium]|nr:hypothetical protein [Planctomycetota bacterium]